MSVRRIQLAAMHSEYIDAFRGVLDLLEDLDTLELLRTHTPLNRRHLVNRLEVAIKLASRVDDEFQGELAESMLDEDD